MLVMAEQFANAKSSIEVTLAGIVMLVREEHFRNADLPIAIILSGREMLDREAQSAKVPFSMEVMP